MTTADTPLVDYKIGDVPTGENPFENKDGKGRARSTGRAARGAPKKPLPPWREGSIAAWATQMYFLGGKALAVYDPVCGAAMQASADAAGRAWEKLAKQSEPWRRFFAFLMTSSAATEVIVANAPLMIAILSHHGPFKTHIQEAGEKFTQEFKDILREDAEAA
jgi:hypothetical protein